MYNETVFVCSFRQERSRREEVEEALRKANELLQKTREEKKKAEREKHFGWHRFVDDDAATRAWTGFPSYDVMKKLYHVYLKDEADQLSLKGGQLGIRPRKRK